MRICGRTKGRSAERIFNLNARVFNKDLLFIFAGEWGWIFLFWLSEGEKVREVGAMNVWSDWRTQKSKM